MLDNEFCNFLEYQLTSAFENSDDEAVKGFWCDGISMPTIESELTKKYVNDKRKIITKAWLGFDGQDEYEMTIHLGQHTAHNKGYAKPSYSGYVICTSVGRHAFPTI